MKLNVKIWSDVMCPFCYIAKNNFEKAVQQLPFGSEIEVQWKSYQLDPELKETSGSKTFGTYLKERKGFSIPQTDQFLAQLTEMGKNSGVSFNHSKTFVANTFYAHKILHLAKKYGKDNEMEEFLFRSLFEDGGNISDHNLLVSLAGKLGIDKIEAEEVLSTEQFDYEVKQDFMEARNMGISGVPFFTIDDKYSISGARPIESFVSALTQAYNDLEKPLENIGDSNGSCNEQGCSL